MANERHTFHGWPLAQWHDSRGRAFYVWTSHDPANCVERREYPELVERELKGPELRAIRVDRRRAKQRDAAKKKWDSNPSHRKQRARYMRDYMRQKRAAERAASRESHPPQQKDSDQ